MKLEFSLDIVSKNTQISNFTKILLVSVVPCGQTDGWRTGMTKLRVALRNFAKASKYKKYTSINLFTVDSPHCSLFPIFSSVP